MPNPKPPYAAEFRQQLVELVQAGRKPAELAKEFGCHVTSIHNWVSQAPPQIVIRSSTHIKQRRTG